MNLQYITDSNGLTTGVYIPIKEWNDLKSKYKDFDREIALVPEWHKAIVRERMASDTQAVDFDTALNEIEKGL